MLHSLAALVISPTLRKTVLVGCLMQSNQTADQSSLRCLEILKLSQEGLV